MSRMKISREVDARMDESREMLLATMYICNNKEEYGSKYIETSYGRMYRRLKNMVHIVPLAETKEKQLKYARTACHTAMAMVSDLVRTNYYGTISLYGAMMVAFGSYVEQEGKKGDQWRDESYTDLYKHLDHEIEELKRSEGRTVRLHNAIDACCLSAMLAVKIEERLDA